MMLLVVLLLGIGVLVVAMVVLVLLRLKPLPLVEWQQDREVASQEGYQQQEVQNKKKKFIHALELVLKRQKKMIKEILLLSMESGAIGVNRVQEQHIAPQAAKI
mgnify:FL=1